MLSLKRGKPLVNQYILLPKSHFISIFFRSIHFIRRFQKIFNIYEVTLHTYILNLQNKSLGSSFNCFCVFIFNSILFQIIWQSYGA